MGDAGGVRPGDVLSGKYRVERVVGEGGMGVVVAATHLQLDQLVAIKLVHPDIVGRPEMVGRLVREARAVARLHSEHVVRVLDVGTLPNGAPFIVMELLHGCDLASVIDGNGPLPASVAVDYVLQACDAIAEAHGLGIIHRDLKPANLFLTTAAHGKTVIKVLDFGVAKTGIPGDLTLTGATSMMGSPAFMSPEQLRSAHTVDGRSDVWSLGVILWQLVCGKVPFLADTFTELCIHIVVDPLPPMPRVPDVPPGLEAVLRRALEKDPDERFATIAELALALAPFTYPGAREIAYRLARRGAGDASTDGTLDQGIEDPTTAHPRAPTAPQRRALRGALVGAAIAVLSAIALLSIPYLRRARSAPADSPPATAPPPPVVVALPPEPPPPPPPPTVEAKPADAGSTTTTTVTPPPARPPVRPPKKPRRPQAPPNVDPFGSAD